MLSIFAKSLMTATRHQPCDVWPDCRQGGPARPYPQMRHSKNWDAPPSWFRLSGPR